ncbi:AI-2E family transporter [Natronomonas sp. EA1]|uniref:AI-2E family transporter n=1 Tax=Natronomonas sp. EA1 TaxID=3421655 RepID=UPI003EBA67AB
MVPDIDRARAAWWGVGLALALAVLFVAYSFVGTFVFALFVYYATRPLYVRVRRYIRRPGVAAAVALLGLALPVLLLVSYTLAIALQELNKASSTVNFGPAAGAVQPYLNVSSAVEDPASLLDDPNFVSTLRETLTQTLDYAGFIGNGLLHVFVVLALAYYLLRDGPKLARWFTNRFGDDRGVLDAYLHAVDQNFTSVFFGNILNALVTGVIGVFAYSVIDVFAPVGHGIPYPALLGLLAGAASLIPVVGMKLVYVPVTLYLLATELLSGEPVLWVAVVFAAVSFVLVDTIPDLVLRPYVSGRNLHTGTVMFAYIFGPLLFGWYGIFLGPIILVLVVHFARLVLPELTSGETIRPFAVDPANVMEVPVSEPDRPGDSTPETTD